MYKMDNLEQISPVTTIITTVREFHTPGRSALCPYRDRTTL